jgi:hypothetical protein
VFFVRPCHFHIPDLSDPVFSRAVEFRGKGES